VDGEGGGGCFFFCGGGVLCACAGDGDLENPIATLTLPATIRKGFVLGCVVCLGFEFEAHEMRVMKVTKDDVVFFGLIKETSTKFRGGE